MDKLESVLGHLESCQQTQLVRMIISFPCLFGDTPSRTMLLKHDIDVGEAKPIRQRFYLVHPEKHKNLEAEIKYRKKPFKRPFLPPLVQPPRRLYSAFAAFDR